MTRTVAVYNKNGKINRQVAIPGRNHTRRPGYGYVDLRGNVGQRDEGDWDVIKALIADGSVSIELTPWEGDVIFEQFKGKQLDYGGNVDFVPARPVPWELVGEAPVEGQGHTKASFYAAHDPRYFCTDHNYQGHTPLEWGRHKMREHSGEKVSTNPETIRRREEQRAKREEAAAVVALLAGRRGPKKRKRVVHPKTTNLGPDGKPKRGRPRKTTEQRREEAAAKVVRGPVVEGPDGTFVQEVEITVPFDQFASEETLNPEAPFVAPEPEEELVEA